MTTSSIATVLDHTTDVGFRAWGSEFASQLAIVGMVQTADTGQINWTTATRAAGGYEIWRFSDSSIYLKITYGNASGPFIQIQAGKGSNGSGTLTGQLSTNSLYTAGFAPSSTVTAYTSRFCHLAGAEAFSFSWKEAYANSGGSNGAYGCIGKTVDGGGIASADGYACQRLNSAGNVSIQAVRTATTPVAAATYNDVNNIIVPGDPNTSSTASTGYSQAYQMPINVPDVQPFGFSCNVLLTEAPRGTSFLVNMVGSAVKTYYSTGGPYAGSSSFGPYAGGRYGPAMVFQ